MDVFSWTRLVFCCVFVKYRLVSHPSSCWVCSSFVPVNFLSVFFEVILCAVTGSCRTKYSWFFCSETRKVFPQSPWRSDVRSFWSGCEELQAFVSLRDSLRLALWKECVNQSAEMTSDAVLHCSFTVNRPAAERPVLSAGFSAVI